MFTGDHTRIKALTAPQMGTEGNGAPTSLRDALGNDLPLPDHFPHQAFSIMDGE